MAMLLQFHTGRGLATLEVVPGEGDACRVSLDGEPVAVELLGAAAGGLDLRIGGRRVRAWVAVAGAAMHVCVEGRGRVLRRHTGDEEPDEAADGVAPHVTAPVPGRVARLLAEPGRSVRAGEALLILEAMKMETEIAAPLAGVIRAVHVTGGQVVALGEPLVDLDPA